MLTLENIQKNVRRRALALFGYAACCLLSILAFGAIGFMASLLFMPVIGLLAVQPNAAPSQETDLGKNQRRPFIIGTLSQFLGEIDHPTVVMVVEIDSYERLQEVYGRTALEGAVSYTQSAIEAHLTEHDITVHLEGSRFVAALAPQAPYNLEALLNTCTRIQHSMAEASLVTNLPVQLTASIGFAASSSLERPTAEGLMDNAFSALAEARRKAPNAVRGYSKTMSTKRLAELKLVKDATGAFERGEILAYFQPQVSIKDGSLTGFEALTRWQHPERGIVAPAEFLPALEKAGLMPQLGDTMIKHAIQALTFWDKSGLHVPQIGVNFATNELRNPRLVERIAMHLDISNIAPERLVIEVLETVVANEADDEIICNLAALADLGCSIDLDDFGTGYASIANIHRFSIGRIKIDRSFVSGIDGDLEQQKMASAIIDMAERLDLKTLAEGIETRGELETLRDLGCQDAQGFQFARPMPIEETVEWASNHFGATQEPVWLSKRAS